MRALWDLYVEYWRINVLTTLEYRTNAVVWFVFTFIYHGTAIASLWVVLSTFPSLNGWNFREMFFLYSLWMAGHALNNTFFANVAHIPESIRDGDFDRLLVRPVDTLLLAIATPGQVFPDELLLAIGYLIVATLALHVRVDAAFVVLVPLIAIGGALIDLGINLVISTAAFWFIKVDALRWIVIQLESEFTRYPISIYSRAVRLLLAFVVPFAFMNYFPASYLLHKSDTGVGLPIWVGALTPAIGVAFAVVAYFFWRFGLRRYASVGH